MTVMYAINFTIFATEVTAAVWIRHLRQRDGFSKELDCSKRVACTVLAHFLVVGIFPSVADDGAKAVAGVVYILLHNLCMCWFLQTVFVATDTAAVPAPLCCSIAMTLVACRHFGLIRTVVAEWIAAGLAAIAAACLSPGHRATAAVAGLLWTLHRALGVPIPLAGLPAAASVCLLLPLPLDQVSVRQKIAIPLVGVAFHTAITVAAGPALVNDYLGFLWVATLGLALLTIM